MFYRKTVFILFLFIFSGSTMAIGSFDFQGGGGSDDSSSDDSSSDDSSSDDSSSDDSSSDDIGSSNSSRDVEALVLQHTQLSCSRDVKRPSFIRTTKPEYFSTYFGNVVNQQSLKEFFNITNNQYGSTCDVLYRKYLSKLFHKALVFAYDAKNIKSITSYWGFSYNGFSRGAAEQDALQKCQSSYDKKESHVCAILFSNNNITNKAYLSLAKK
jgi:hypothetical protein